jgi:hypothetical protein
MELDSCGRLQALAVPGKGIVGHPLPLLLIAPASAAVCLLFSDSRAGSNFAIPSSVVISMMFDRTTGAMPLQQQHPSFCCSNTRSSQFRVCS